MLTIIRRWLLMSLVPYGMYAVAYVLESRKPGRDVAIWRGQSKAFVPGDAGLALFIAVAKPGGRVSPRRHVAGLFLGLVSLVALRRLTYRPEDYTVNQWRSPSKLYHDLVVCVLFGYLVVVRALPFYAGRPVSDALLQKLVGASGVLIWASGVIWDESHDEVPNYYQHPDVWWPIWDRRPGVPLLW
ncbi:MAG: hypothetical protein EOO17_03160 [Chloroflexi bacterium]|nr:MAG: hypothetical protein EOO17_03160 [Chloroflexota bacterium]